MILPLRLGRGHQFSDKADFITLIPCKVNNQKSLHIHSYLDTCHAGFSISILFISETLLFFLFMKYDKHL